MRERVAFIFKYIWKLMIKNPVKMVFIILLVLSYNIYSNSENVTVKKEVVECIEHKDKFIYLTVYGSGGDIKYNIRVYKREDAPEIDGGGFIEVIEFSNTKAISIFSICVIAFILLIASFGQETSWDFDTIYWDCEVNEVSRHEDNDFIYYVYRNKVVCTQNNEEAYTPPDLSFWHLKNSIKSCKETPNLFKTYEGTKSEIRDKKIKNVIG